MIKRELIIVKAVSKFHLYGAFSYILENNFLKHNNFFIICSAYHVASKSYRVNEADCDILKNENFIFQKIKDDNDVIINVNEKETIERVVVINALSVPIKILLKCKKKYPFIRPLCVLIDEGISTYKSGSYWRKERRIVCNNASFLWFIKDYTKYILIKVIEKILIKKKEFFLFSDFDFMKLNETVIKSYQNFFTFTRSRCNKILASKKNILIVSDVLRDYLKNEIEIEIYNKVIDILKAKYSDYGIYLKPHPNEKERFKLNIGKRINCNILYESVSSEMLYRDEDIKLVIGFASTSLITSALFFQLETISIVNMIPESELTNMKKEHVNLFKNAVKNIPLIKYNL